jgi:lysyl-tRNA synthetase class 1
VPIFYEHLLIDGEKMSASLGNVVYPKDWLKVAPPELLRFFYSKKLMKSRSFSWSTLPNIYDDYDLHERIYFGKAKVDNPKEREHMKRLYETSQISVPKEMPVQIPFDFAVTMAQIFPDGKLHEAIDVFKASGHIKGRLSKSDEEAIRLRLSHAKAWAELHAPEQYRIKLMEKPRVVKLSEGQRKAIKELAGLLERKKLSQEDLHSAFWDIAKGAGVTPQEFFRGAYMVLIGKESGPKLAMFILAVGQKKIAGILEQVK